MREYGFPSTRIFHYEGSIVDSVFIRENRLFSKNRFSRIFNALDILKISEVEVNIL